jgi:hypothetical protein
LTVEHFVGIADDHLAYWCCQCTCGKAVVVTGANLRRKNTRSCGCFFNETPLIASRCPFCLDDPRLFLPLKPKNRLVDITDQSFDRLIVRHLVGIDPLRKAHWCCECSCGNFTIVSGPQLRNRRTRSCGCLVFEQVNDGQFVSTHGMTESPEFSSWSSMLSRCLNPNATGFQHYGGRGVTVCERWQTSFEAFLADAGPRPPGTSLDRIDTNGNYEPGNVRWATRQEQANNRRDSYVISHNGIARTLSAWVHYATVPLSYDTLRSRLEAGWDMDEALTTPRGQSPNALKGGEACRELPLH